MDISNSLIIQWGEISATNVTFPISFSNTTYKFVRAWYAGGGSGEVFYNGFGAGDKTINGCITNYDSRNINQDYIVIGY